MNHRFLSLGLACVCTGALSLPAVASPALFSFDDYSKVVAVSDAQISPDGKEIVIVVGHVDEKKDRTLRELVLVDVATGSERVLTHNRDGVGDPRWSPTGDRLAFIDVAGSGDAAAPQVWIMPMNGGDAQPVTTAKNGVETYAWRPDGNAIAYVTSDTPANETAIEHHDDLFKVGDDPFSARSSPVPSHLWLQDLNARDPQRLTQGTWSIYPDALSWSADSKYIAFDRLPVAGYDAIPSSQVAVLNVATKAVQTDSYGDRWSWLSVFAPQGDRLAYSAGSHGSSLVFNDLIVATAGSRDARNAAPSLNRDVDFLAWLPNDAGILVGADDRITHALFRVSASGQDQRIDLGDLNFDGGTVAKDGAIAFVGTSATRPAELYYLAPGSNAPRRLTEYNSWTSDLNLAKPREFTWHNDGFEENGVLTYPVGYEPGKKYPLVLAIHGGPTIGASTTSFSPLAQVLAANGFFVLQPNYRGSDNFGWAYADAIVGPNPSFGAGSDIVAGVKALEATGMIDSSRVGVSGWSAGGWMTSWLITRYDGMWKAAVTGAALDDIVMQASVSELNSLVPMLFGGLTPWAPGGLEAYRRNSPITYAQNVKAATLILSDTTDPRVPTPQAYEFYSALRAYGKDVEFVAIPAYGHHPEDPVRNKAIDRTWADWFIQHLSAH
jgi:dipeptidyl aminopeptidase/acylaminoacyl peptidase